MCRVRGTLFLGPQQDTLSSSTFIGVAMCCKGNLCTWAESFTRILLACFRAAPVVCLPMDEVYIVPNGSAALHRYGLLRFHWACAQVLSYRFDCDND